MLKTFPGTDRYARALQVWLILIGMANNRQSTTYAKLATLMEYPQKAQAVLDQFLDPVMRYCQRNGLPPLTILVTGVNSGVPGPGFPAGSDLNKARADVFKYPWFRLFPPEIADLR